jgi:hypothetical protein
MGLFLVGCEDAPISVLDVVLDEATFTSERGMSRSVGCQHDADCPRGAMCPAAYGTCVWPCHSDADCVAPSRCLLDRLETNFCACESAECDAAMRRF